MDQKKEIRQRLWQSLEMDHIRSTMIVYTVAIAAVLGIWCLRSWNVPDVLSVGLSVFGVFWVVIMAVYGIWIIRIFRQEQQYVFCKAKLTNLHGGKVRNTMYFTVVLEIPGEGKIAENTQAIFQTHGWPGPLVEDYVNRTVEIAYNESTEQVVVIG